MPPESDNCHVCAQKGQQSSLQLFQINLEEAVWMCPKPQCPYPLSETSSSTPVVIQRPASQILKAKRRRSRNHSRSTSCSSSRSGSPVSFTQLIRRNSSKPISPPVSSTLSSSTVLSKAPATFVKTLTKKLAHVKPLQPPALPKFDMKALVSPSKKIFHRNNGSSQFNTSQKRAQASDQTLAALEQFSNDIPSIPTMEGGCFLPPPQPERIHNNPMAKADSESVGFENLFDIEDQAPALESKLPCDIKAEDYRDNLTDFDNSFSEVNVKAERDDGSYFDPAQMEIFCLADSTKKVKGQSIDHPFGLNDKTIHVVEGMVQKPSGKSEKHEVKQEVSTLCSSGEIPVTPIPKELQSVASALKSVYHLHWSNKDALCWLDVAMSLLVHSRTVHSLVRCRTKKTIPVLKELVTAFSRAQALLKKALELKRYQLLGQKRSVLLETSVGKVTVKTGGGDATKVISQQAPLVFNTNLSPIAPRVHRKGVGKLDTNMVITTEELQSKSDMLSNEAKKILDATREYVWEFLYPKLRCEKGENDSPVFALPLLIGENPEVREKFMHRFEWRMTCTECGHKHTDKVCKPLLTFPAVPADFSMRAPYFLRACFACDAPSQRMTMVPEERYPSIILAHFVDGLHKHPTRYDFFLNKHVYWVTGVVQYRHDPDHFVTWIRQPQLNLWLECDDLKPPLVRYSNQMPDFHPSQVHVVMWTRRNPSPTSIMPLFLAPKNGMVSTVGDYMSAVEAQHVTQALPPPPLKGVLKSPQNTAAPIATVTVTKPPTKTPSFVAKVGNCSSELIAKGPTKTVQPKKPAAPRRKKNQLESLKTDIKPLINGNGNIVPPHVNSPPAQKKINLNVAKLQPKDLAKQILSRGLLTGLNSSNKLKGDIKVKKYGPAFQGYVPKAVDDTTSNSEKKLCVDSKVGLRARSLKSVCFKERSRTPTPEPNMSSRVKRKPAKRKSDSDLARQLKARKMDADVSHMLSTTNDACVNSVVNAMSPPPNNANDSGMQLDIFSPKSVTAVLGELCDKLDVPQEGFGGIGATNGFNIDDLFTENSNVINGNESLNGNGNVIPDNLDVPDIDFDMFF